MGKLFYRDRLWAEWGEEVSKGSGSHQDANTVAVCEQNHYSCNELDPDLFVRYSRRDG